MDNEKLTDRERLIIALENLRHISLERMIDASSRDISMEGISRAIVQLEEVIGIEELWITTE